MSEKRVALIAGVTGIVGLNLAKHLLGPDAATRWSKVYGVSRRKQSFLPEGIHHISCDLQDQSEAKSKLGQLDDVTHVFYCTWMNMMKEEENIKVNSALLENLLDGLSCPLKHAVLVTGTKHYAGTLESLLPPEVAALVETPFKERMPRLSMPNFYYSQEDVLFDRAKKRNFTWSVARPCAIIGYAPANQMNFGISLAVYATICKHANLPFMFPGSTVCLDNFLDATDAQLLAKHLEWETTTPGAQNEAFNVVNGDIFRWRFMWRDIAEYFGLEVPEHNGSSLDMEEFGKVHSSTWDDIVAKCHLKPYKLNELFQGWLINVIMSVNVSVMSDMSKSREKGFLEYQNTTKAFTKLFDELKADKTIP